MAKTTSRKLCFALISVTAALVGLEILARSIPLPVAESLSDLAFAQADAPELYEADPELGWKLRPNLQVNFAGVAVRTSALGLRGAEARDPVVLCLGDSVTFGYFVGEDESYPALLAREFGVETLAAGVPGYSSAQGKVLLGRLLQRFRPRVVVISFGYNDGVRFPIADGGQGGNASPGVVRVVRRSAIARWLDRWIGMGRKVRLARQILELRARNLAAFPPTDVLAAQRFESGESLIRSHLRNASARVPVVAYQERLREMIQLAREHGAEVVLLAPPFASHSREPYFAASSRAEPVAVYRQAMQEVSREAGVAFVRAPALEERESSPDRELFVTRRLAPEESEGFRLLKLGGAQGQRLGLDARLRLRTDLAHPSAAGHAHIAAALADLLRAKGLGSTVR